MRIALHESAPTGLSVFQLTTANLNDADVDIASTFTLTGTGDQLDGLTIIDSAGTANVTVTAAADYSDAEKVAMAIADFAFVTTTSDDLTLASEGTNGVTITWATTMGVYISSAGVVTNPLFTTGDVDVDLVVQQLA